MGGRTGGEVIDGDGDAQVVAALQDVLQQCRLASAQEPPVQAQS